MEEKKVLETVGETLLDFVLTKYKIGKKFWSPYQDNWKEIKTEYEGVYDEGKEWWQANIIVPTLKKVVRALISLYVSILLSKGAESFDIAPGEKEDKKNAELLRYKIIYDLTTLEIEKKIIPILQNFILYGYAVAYVPWKHTIEKMRTGKNTVKDVVTFDGPDIENANLFNLVSDPNCKDLSSWKVYKKDDVPIYYLKQKEGDIYFNIDKLKETTYPGTREDATKDIAETLEYHGLVPKKLIEGKMDDLVEANPFDDEYVQAIIVVANQKVVIRASAYPYWVNNIFVPFVNDHMTDEIVGTGSGTDLKALAPMLTNLYNKLTDCVNIVTNPMYEMVVKRYLGRAKTILMQPGRIIPVRELNTIREINTTAQAASIRVIQELITMVDKIIEEITGTTPQVMPTGDRKDVHATAAGMAMMTEKSMQPVHFKVKFVLEPAFRKILSIIYRHNIQKFKKERAIRILGKKAEKFDLEDITREDIMMKGNPDFIPTGVSGFLERQIEIRGLLDFMKILSGIMIPVTKPDYMGNEEPVYDPEGKPAMKPLGNVAVIVRKIAELQRIKDLDEILPEEEKQEKPKEPKVPPRIDSQSGAGRGVTPLTSPGGAYLGRNLAGAGGSVRRIKGE